MDTIGMTTTLERRRKKVGMSKIRLSERAGVSVATVHRLLGGTETRLSVGSVTVLAAALGLEVVLGARVRVEETESATAFRERQARHKARRRVRKSTGSGKGVPEKVARELEEQTVLDLLAGSPRRLWSE